MNCYWLSKYGFRLDEDKSESSCRVRVRQDMRNDPAASVSEINTACSKSFNQISRLAQR
jgi:hypothetical protein